MYIYLDESGCLGFDFTKQGTSRFFVITLLVINSNDMNKKMLKMVERTIKTKIQKKKKTKAIDIEFKGSKTDIKVKNYFYNLVKNSEFEIFTIVLNKARVIEKLRNKKEKLYNYISKFILEKCQFHKAENRIILTVDKRKNREGVEDFNNYLLIQLQKKLSHRTPFEMHHSTSISHKGLQAVDVFCWGIWRKYEKNDIEWYYQYKDKIKFETVYLPPKMLWF